MVVIEEPIHRDLAVGILEPVFGLLAPVLYNPSNQSWHPSVYEFTTIWVRAETTHLRLAINDAMAKRKVPIDRAKEKYCLRTRCLLYAAVGRV